MSRGLCRNGSGLGLFIVKTVMDQHGEPIEINSCEGKYCEFIFSLPLVSKPKKIASFGLSDLPLSEVPSSFHFTSKELEDAELYDFNDPLQPPLHENADDLEISVIGTPTDTPETSAEVSETPAETTETSETPETPDVSDTSGDAQK